MYAVQTMRIIILAVLNLVLLHILSSCFPPKRKEGCIEAGVLVLSRWQHSMF